VCARNVQHIGSFLRGQFSMYGNSADRWSGFAGAQTLVSTAGGRMIGYGLVTVDAINAMR
jgi:hypothetical protein